VFHQVGVFEMVPVFMFRRDFFLRFSTFFPPQCFDPFVRDVPFVSLEGQGGSVREGAEPGGIIGEFGISRGGFGG